MGAFKTWHIIVLVVVVVLLFGAKRLPDMARSLGRSMRILKAETKGLMDDDKKDSPDDLADKADARTGARRSRRRLPAGGCHALRRSARSRPLT